MARRILRKAIQIVATIAGVVFLFDNRFSSSGLAVLVASIAVLLVCLFLWLIFDLGEDTGFWPKGS